MSDPRVHGPGEDRSQTVLPRRELCWTAAALVVTGIVTAAVIAVMAVTLGGLAADGRWGQVLLGVVIDVCSLGLVSGGLVHLCTRWGHYRRRAQLARHGVGEEDGLFGPDADPGLLTVLVPSYREDPAVIRRTLLSAALQEYPERRVVLLVDDPPTPAAAEHVAALAAVRRLPAQIAEFLREPAEALAEEARAFRARTSATGCPTAEQLAAEGRRVAVLYERAAAWFEEQHRREAVHDHTGRLFVQLTYAAPAAACRRRAAALGAGRGTATPTLVELEQHHRRLACLFAVEVCVFERKRYVNLSHAANKAMNLNAYIGLLGRRWRQVARPDGVHLEEAVPGRRGPRSLAGPVLDVPASPWLLTLDADSLLTHDYAARLVTAMRRPEHARVAVMQTPYSAVPGATSPVERTAGATTDIMQLVHQGSTHFDATFWVGANALVRTVALGDLAVTAMEGPKVVRRYIHERTVIEDTESTVDLVDAGWRVHNYPARLAYSATPPDYGSLLIQRRRWANGGLIILPKLLRSLRRRGLRGRGAEAFIRVHYLVSIATSNVALLLLLALPSTHGAPVELVAVTCLPYFVIYARDLRLLGRRRRDLFEVYCLNLLLLPVNLGGVVMSVRQGLSGRRIPFGRTPKISDRTAAPASYLAGTFGLLALWAAGALLDASSGRPVHGVLGALNAAVLAFAISRYMGWRHAVADLLAPVRALRRRSRPAVPEAPAASEGDAVQPEPTVAITLPARTGAAA